MATILVVEDDKRTNEIICDYLDATGYRVLHAYEGITALELLASEQVDLVILDIMMPGMDGYTVCKRIRASYDVTIVFLTARADEADKLMGFEYGAIEYVTKPFSPKVLVARIRALLNYKNDELERMRKGDLEVDMQSYIVKVSGERIELTPKEYELLFLLMRNESKVLKRETIIDRVWGRDYYGDGRVLDTNIKTLRKKIMQCASYIQTVIGIGYKFEVPNV